MRQNGEVEELGISASPQRQQGIPCRRCGLVEMLPFIWRNPTIAPAGVKLIEECLPLRARASRGERLRRNQPVGFGYFLEMSFFIDADNAHDPPGVMGFTI